MPVQYMLIPLHVIEAMPDKETTKIESQLDDLSADTWKFSHTPILNQKKAQN